MMLSGVEDGRTEYRASFLRSPAHPGDDRQPHNHPMKTGKSFLLPAVKFNSPKFKYNRITCKSNNSRFLHKYDQQTLKLQCVIYQMSCNVCRSMQDLKYFTIFLPQNPLKSIRRADKKQETVGFDQKMTLNCCFCKFYDFCLDISCIGLTGRSFFFDN